MTLNKYYHIGKINFYNSFVYVADSISGSVFVGVIVLIFTYLWGAVFETRAIEEGFTLGMVIWYFVMSESIVTAYGRKVEEIGNEIKSGEIANYLNKPYNYLIYKYASSLGQAAFKFCTTLIISSCIVYFMIREFSFSFQYFPLVLISVFLAVTLNFVLMVFLGTFAFWFEDSESLHFIYQKIVFTIGGMLIPLEFFPKWLAAISSWLPFSYIAYFPSKLFVKFSWLFFAKVLLLQTAWILLFTLLTYIVFRIGIKKVSANGG